jgi:type II secretory pathway component GspD/PulD (secretin)
LALENREAEVLIGERLGYKVTTTINQVTSESVEYLDSGVILRVLPAVDESGRIVLEIHPEVSTGIVVDGIPNQTTTEVTTQLVAEDGQTIFIAGLIKDRTTRTHSGVPLLGSIPVLGRLFSRDEDTTVNTETVVLITPHIVTAQWWQAFAEQGTRVDRVERELQARGSQIDRKVQRVSRIDDLFSSPEEVDSGSENSSSMGP